MNIATLIAKFIKDGFEALKDEEKQLLKDNVSLMSPSQREKFEEATKEVDPEEKEEEEEEEAEEEEEEEEEAVDEKALKAMISKSVQDEIGEQVDSISEKLVTKFFAGAKDQRKKVIDTGKKGDTDGNETLELL